MKKLHRTLQQKQANFVKKLAKQVKPIGSYFTEKQKKELNKFYKENAITPLQAKFEVQRLKLSKATKLFFTMMSDETIKVNPIGNCFNEKLSMVVFCASNGITKEKFQKELHVFYGENKYFNNNN